MVIEVEQLELPDQLVKVFVTVAYATSEDVDRGYPGEIGIESGDSHAGLAPDMSSKSGRGKKAKP